MMLRIKPLLVLCAALLTVTPAASADVNSDMNQNTIKKEHCNKLQYSLLSNIL